MTEKKKFYQQGWFIVLLLFSPLFPIGLFLMWKEKNFHIIGKIFFTCVWAYAVLYTFQTQHVEFLPKQAPVEEKIEAKGTFKDIIVAYISKHEDTYGEYYLSERKNKNTFNQSKFDSAYVVQTSVGKFDFYLKDKKIVKIEEEN